MQQKVIGIFFNIFFVRSQCISEICDVHFLHTVFLIQRGLWFCDYRSLFTFSVNIRVSDYIFWKQVARYWKIKYFSKKWEERLCFFNVFQIFLQFSKNLYTKVFVLFDNCNPFNPDNQLSVNQTKLKCNEGI